jgi:hypothetical protein
MLDPDGVGKVATRPNRQQVKIGVASTPAGSRPIQAWPDLFPAALIRAPATTNGHIVGL